MSDAHLSQLTFESLQIPESLKRGIAELGYTRCTPIQAQTLPVALAGRDVAGQAQTGTGKTAAFLIALFNRLLTQPAGGNVPRNAPRAIVIAPTRELAVQIHSDAEGIAKYTGLKLAIVFGGVDYDKQRRILEEGVDVLIGTPGRVIDYFKQGVFDLRHIQVAVMDEADRMFDLGFIKDIRFILRRLPDPTLRLTMMFSATLSHRVMELAYEHMNNPELIRIEPDKMTVDRVKQVLYFPATEEKIPLLMGLLRRIDARRTMVFVNTKRIAEVLERTLTANGFVAQALSGDVPQNKRLKMMRDFHDGEIAVLIATDVASRGLHIPDVSHVFNFDLPNDAEDYVHRIGRTARAGAEGDAISFGCEEYAISLPDIERYIGHQIPRAAIDTIDLAVVTAPPPAEWRERAPRPGQSRPGQSRPGGPSRGGRPGGGGGGGGGRSGGSSGSGGRSGGGERSGGSGGRFASGRASGSGNGAVNGERPSDHAADYSASQQSANPAGQTLHQAAQHGGQPSRQSTQTSDRQPAAAPSDGGAPRAGHEGSAGGGPSRRRRRRNRGGGGPAGGTPNPGTPGPGSSGGSAT
jgi:ATP-dependent RNA helicase RhlB